MATTQVDRPPSAGLRAVRSSEKKVNDTPDAYGVYDDFRPSYDSDEKPRIDSTHRKLKPRHIQLIGIGGYVSQPLTAPRRSLLMQAIFEGQLERHCLCRLVCIRYLL